MALRSTYLVSGGFKISGPIIFGLDLQSVVPMSSLIFDLIYVFTVK